MWQCKWRHLVATSATNSHSATWRVKLELMHSKTCFSHACRFLLSSSENLKSSTLKVCHTHDLQLCGKGRGVQNAKHCQRHNGPRVLTPYLKLSLQLKWLQGVEIIWDTRSIPWVRCASGFVYYIIINCLRWYMKFICEIDVMSLLLLQNSQTHCLINPYCKELSVSWNQSNHLLGLLLCTIMTKRTVTSFNPS